MEFIINSDAINSVTAIPNENRLSKLYFVKKNKLENSINKEIIICNKENVVCPVPIINPRNKYLIGIAINANLKIDR